MLRRQRSNAAFNRGCWSILTLSLHGLRRRRSFSCSSCTSCITFCSVTLVYFSCVTKVDNLVFDSVINALLCRMFSGKAYTSFFTDFYDQRQFPACLLRPPLGWSPSSYPAPPIALRGRTRKALAEVHRALYSERAPPITTSLKL